LYGGEDFDFGNRSLKRCRVCRQQAGSASESSHSVNPAGISIRARVAIIHQFFFLESPCEESDVPYLDDSLHGFFSELPPDLLCSDDSLQPFFPETRFLDGSAAGFRLWAVLRLDGSAAGFRLWAVPRLDGSAAGFWLWAVLRPAGAAPRSEESLARPADEAGRREVPALAGRASRRAELVLEWSDRPAVRGGRSSEREGCVFSMTGLVAGAFGLSGHGITFLVATSPRISVFQHTPCSIGCAAVGRLSDRTERSSVRTGRSSERAGRSSARLGRSSERAGCSSARVGRSLA
jgi:hypothetical protein